mmetsp:Transcript_49092/g.83885  ORF Transcript_49092/g.83885 Transcript_49092/m.83885 type:complete len:210 (-) Transcript_49092:29-658(-)
MPLVCSFAVPLRRLLFRLPHPSTVFVQETQRELRGRHPWTVIRPDGPLVPARSFRVRLRHGPPPLLAQAAQVVARVRGALPRRTHPHLHHGRHLPLFQARQLFELGLPAAHAPSQHKVPPRGVPEQLLRARGQGGPAHGAGLAHPKAAQAGHAGGVKTVPARQSAASERRVRDHRRRRRRRLRPLPALCRPCPPPHPLLNSCVSCLLLV